MSNERTRSLPGQTTGVRGADCPGRRPGQHGPGGVAARLRRRCQAAVRAHDLRCRQARVGCSAAEPVQVAAEQGRQVRVDHGGRRALVLAEHGQQVVRGGDVHAGQTLRHRLRDTALVLGPGLGVQQADGDRFDLLRRRSGPACGPAPSSSRGEITSRGELRSSAAKRSSGGHQRRRAGRAQPVQLRPRLARHLEHVGEPLRGDQGGARSALLQEGVGGDRHPVPEAGNVARRRHRRARAHGRRPPSRPRDWSAGVVGTFAVNRPVPDASTASVNVPPTSTPSAQPSVLRATGCESNQRSRCKPTSEHRDRGGGFRSRRPLLLPRSVREAAKPPARPAPGPRRSP